MPTLETRVTLVKKTKKELIEIARKLDITKVHSLRKEKLVDKILNLMPNTASLTKTDKIIKETIKTSTPTSSSSFNSNYTMPKEDKEVDKYPLPENYGDTKITLLVKSPKAIFTYWEINANVVKLNKLVEKALILRVYDITDIIFDGHNENYHFDINITLSNTDWYIKVPEPNREYCVDLGYISENGLFFRIARSNVVSIPRNSVSSNYDEEWMLVEELFRLSGGQRGQARLSSSMDVEKMLTERLKMSSTSSCAFSIKE